ncbi:MAG TPA: alpha/beta fold hydrolase [Rhodothermales bacterium]
MAPSDRDLLLPSGDDDARTSTRTKALVTGSVALGALITGAVLEKARHRKYPLPVRLPRAVDAAVRELEIMEGVTRFYYRAGEGTPIVFLHGINAGGSTFEMKPLFDYFASTTNRPLFAIDWLGFGKSDRPPVNYAPGLYQRQLRRTLSECVGEPADVVTLSLSSEYAATVANAFPFLFRHLVLIAPTAMGRNREPARLQSALVSAAGRAGMFELMFSRMSSRESLRSFYARNVFAPGTTVSDDLVDYAFLTTHIRGAHFAPRRFIQGALFMRDYATRGYRSLSVPTLILVPERHAGTIQHFEMADEVAAANSNLRVERLPLGLLPHWEDAAAVGAVLERFLAPAGTVEETV